MTVAQTTFFFVLIVAVQFAFIFIQLRILKDSSDRHKERWSDFSRREKERWYEFIHDYERHWLEFINANEERWTAFMRSYDENRSFDRESGASEGNLRSIVEQAEQAAQVRLTWGARRMLITPVIERIERQGAVDWDQVNESIRDIVRTIGEEGRRPELPEQVRDSVSVIGGFWRRFCNIPPFCSRTEEGLR